jgi:hypothetical protein
VAGAEPFSRPSAVAVKYVFKNHLSSCRQVRVRKQILEKSGAVKNPVSYYLFEENWYAVAFGVKVLIAVA